MARLADFIEVVEKSDQPEAERHNDTAPDIGIAQVHPQQARHAERCEDQQPTHCWRAALGKMRLRAILADRLPLALTQAQPADKLRTDQQAEEQRSRHRATGAEAEVAEQVGYAGKAK